MRDPEQHWRRHCLPGQEDLFAKVAARYKFGDQVEQQISTAVNWEAYIDRQARIAGRMTRARIGAMVLAAAYRVRVTRLSKFLLRPQGGRKKVDTTTGNIRNVGDLVN